MTEEKIKYSDLSPAEQENLLNLRPAKRQHTELSDTQIQQIQLIWSMIKQPFPETYEQFERSFLFERDIDKEITCWGRIGFAWQRFVKAVKADKKEIFVTGSPAAEMGVIFSYFILVTMGGEPPEEGATNYLTDEGCDFIAECLKNPFDTDD